MTIYAKMATPITIVVDTCIFIKGSLTGTDWCDYVLNKIADKDVILAVNRQIQREIIFKYLILRGEKTGAVRCPLA